MGKIRLHRYMSIITPRYHWAEGRNRGVTIRQKCGYTY